MKDDSPLKAGPTPGAELFPMTAEESLEKARRFLGDNSITFDSVTARRVFAGLIAAKRVERTRLLDFFKRNIHSSHYVRIEKAIPPEL